MSVRDFLVLGYTSWKECHWTLAATWEQAEKWFADRGLSGEIHRVCFPTNHKDSDGFFAWWLGIR